MDIAALQQAPYLFDRWEDQVALEEETLETSKERQTARINKAKEKGDMSNMRPHRKIIQEWALPVAEYLEKWLVDAKKARGAKHIALPLLEMVDPKVAAIVATRAMIRKLGLGERGVLGVAQEIGTAVEHEIQADAWLHDDKESWRALAAHYKSRGSTSQHIGRSRVAIFNKHVAGRLGWDFWTWEQRQRVGLQLIWCVIESTKRFRIIADPDWTPAMGQKSRRPNILVADPELLIWLESAMADEVVHSSVFYPTLIPPKRWEGPRGGGYWTPFVRAPFLIRFKAHQEETRQNALDEFDALDMPEVYKGVNYVQECKWAINGRVFDIMKAFWDHGLGVCGLPDQSEIVTEEMPPEAELDPKIMKAWRRRVSDQKAYEATRVNDYLTVRRMILLAERMDREGLFYFPHMLDFRGRQYPIPSELSPQGDDLHRGLLCAHPSEGKKLDEESAVWLKIHLANVWGMDKVDWDERLEWVDKNQGLWERIDADPMSAREWEDADGGDSPWQALAAVFELRAYQKDPANFRSTLPIRVDGTCNGIQHLAAMVRDLASGTAVNLVPGDAPNDIYRDVAEDLTKVLWEYVAEKAEGWERADRWLTMLGGQVTRSLTKRPVMIVPYGGTLHAYLKYIRQWLDENHPATEEQKDDKELFKERLKDIAFLSRLCWNAVGSHVEKAKEVMDWLKANARIAAESNGSLSWRTPSGFICRQFYAKTKATKVEMKVDGQRFQFMHEVPTKDLDVEAQLLSIAPNFVHSMDAAALTRCIVKCFEEQGITFFTAIHDSYGTVAADMWKLHRTLREAFVEIHQEPVLEQFQEACKAANRRGEKWPEPLAMGALDIEKVKESKYFFL